MYTCIYAHTYTHSKCMTVAAQNREAKGIKIMLLPLYCPGSGKGTNLQDACGNTWYNN